MPIRDNTHYCINHTDKTMKRNAGLNAITVVEKPESGEFNFKPGSGIPVFVYYCEECGYIEIYSSAIAK